MNWLEFYKEVEADKNGNYFLQLPRMIQDMLRTHAQYKESPHFNSLEKPMLRVFGGTPYNMTDVYNGLLFLYERGIKSFILLENSTYTLQLIYTLLDLNNTKSLFNVGINDTFIISISDSWNQPIVISGVIIQLRGRNNSRKNSLPSNVIS